MSKLSETLGVEERQEFTFENTELFVKGNRIFLKNSDELWTELRSARFLCNLIAHSEKIEIIPKKIKLTEEQITAIKGRIAEGWLWVGVDRPDSYPAAFRYEPRKTEYGVLQDWTGRYSMINDEIFNFITLENSPVYLPYLIGDEQE